MLGAEQIFMVDHHDYRLAYAQRTYGVIPINFDDDDDPADTIIRQTAGSRGVDAVIDAVGFEAKGSTTETVLATLKLEGSSGKALRQCIASVRRGGVVSVPGVYSGFIHGFLFGDAFDKGLTFKMGQTHVQRYLPELLGHIETGRLQPEAIITHRMSLEQAAEGYKLFDKKQEQCRKVILTPGSSDVPLTENLESEAVPVM
jgi:threonine dehydrogenase-like Zn-dependent dehydrogenase